MDDQDYKYDVAISFGVQDEEFANELTSLLEERLTVFLYSKRQEEISGTDGEDTFNRIFGSQSRLVVILYREQWGQTPFTRFEETAIRNRAFHHGYDFTVVIPMDEAARQKVPKWMPKNRLYVGLQRWGIQSAVGVIEARVTELGGEASEETIEGLARRAQRELDFKQRRKEYIDSGSGIPAQDRAYEVIREELEAAIAVLRSEGMDVSHRPIADDPLAPILLLSGGFSITVQWRRRFANSLIDAKLVVTIWRGNPPWPGFYSFEKPENCHEETFDPDMFVDGTAGWKSTSGTLTSSLVVKQMIKQFTKILVGG